MSNFVILDFFENSGAFFDFPHIAIAFALPGLRGGAPREGGEGWFDKLTNHTSALLVETEIRGTFPPLFTIIELGSCFIKGDSCSMAGMTFQTDYF